MEKISFLLCKCILFSEFSQDEIIDALKCINYTIKSFDKSQVVALEDSTCTSLGIVLSGSVEVQKIFASGNNITIDKLDDGSIFGEVIIFSFRNTYPSSIISVSKSDIMFISRDNISKLCNLNSKFLINFMSLLSNKILTLNKKLKAMSYQTIRQKITFYILEQCSLQKNSEITLPCSKRELSEQLGIPRPSLSRELINMKDNGLITLDKFRITIIDMESLENILLE